MEMNATVSITLESNLKETIKKKKKKTHAVLKRWSELPESDSLVSMGEEL